MNDVSTARDFSVMPVQVEGEPKPIERAVRSAGETFQVGSVCTVEFGATWATIRERQVRVDGQWFRCQIIRHEGAIVHVRLLPDVRLSTPVRSDAPAAACVCDEGWVCEDHPDQPLNHDGCGGAGMKCDNRRCEWWRGDSPRALNTDDWENRVLIRDRLRSKKRPQ